MYQIATEGGLSGHVQKNLKASIVLGLKQGYDGFLQEKKEVLDFLTNIYCEAGKEGRPFIPFTVSEVIVTYAYPVDGGWRGEHEPALLLTSDKNPLYTASISVEDWKLMIETYVTKLGSHFQQHRVYLAYEEVETKIFQKQ